MNLKTVKDFTTDIQLKGITFTWIKEDGYPRELRLADVDGNHVIIRTNDYGSLRILQEVSEEEKGRV